MRAYPSREKLRSMKEYAWIALTKVQPCVFSPTRIESLAVTWFPEADEADSNILRSNLKINFTYIGDSRKTYVATASVMGVDFVVDGSMSGDEKETARLAVLELSASVGVYVVKMQSDDRLMTPRVKQPVSFDFGSYKQLPTLTPTWRLMAKNKTEFAKCGQVDDLRDLTIKALKTKLTERESELASVKAENERLSSALKKIIVLCESEVWQTKR